MGDGNTPEIQEEVQPTLPLEPEQEAQVEVPAEEAPVAAEAVSEVTEPESEVEASAGKPDWRDKELKRKHAKLKELERTLAEREKEAADLRAIAEARPATIAAAPEAPVELPRAPQSMTPAQIQEAARQLREQERYQENLVKINQAGETAYKAEWAKALENLATLGVVEQDTMQAILGTDAPEKVLYELGKNPAEYQRIMDLPKNRQHTEFVKLSLKQEAPKPKPSSAPAPTEPIQARVQPSSELSDKDDDDTWYKKRAAMRSARRKERLGA